MLVFYYSKNEGSWEEQDERFFKFPFYLVLLEVLMSEICTPGPRVHAVRLNRAHSAFRVVA